MSAAHPAPSARARPRTSAPDGYTVYAVHDYIHLTFYAGISDVKYSDFEPICLVAATPSVLTASAKTPWKNWQELADDAKKRPGEITVGATLGSTSHIFPAMIEKAAGVKFKFVSYDGLAPRMNALLGGHINLTDSNLTQKGKVEAGLLRFIAIASEKRDPESPDVPTLKELGMNIVYEVVRGILVPKGTPAPVRAKLEEACAKATKEPSFAQAMKLQGTRVAFLNANDYAPVPRQDRRREQDHHDRSRPDQEMSIGRDGIAGLVLLAISLVLLVKSFQLPVPSRSFRSGRAFTRPSCCPSWRRRARCWCCRTSCKRAPVAAGAGERAAAKLPAGRDRVRDRRRLRGAAAAAGISRRHGAVRRRAAGRAGPAAHARGNGRCSPRSRSAPPR